MNANFSKDLASVLRNIMQRQNEWEGVVRSTVIEVGADEDLKDWGISCLGEGTIESFPLRVTTVLRECSSPQHVAAIITSKLEEQSKWSRER